MMLKDSIGIPARIPAKAGPRIGEAWFKGLLRALDCLGTWAERAAQRRQLASLDERMLRDIGRSHSDALRESAKPFWRG